jgi:hypothetical protein
MGGVEELGVRTIFVMLFSFASILFIMFSLLWLSWKREFRRGDVCPYTKKPMRLGLDVARSLAAQVNAFVEELPQPDNPPIDFDRAAHCPITGRIFPLCVSTTGEQIFLSWDFISKRTKGTFVSWGSLSEEERGVVKLLHNSLEGFQTEQSSLRPRPQDVEEEYALLSPGPLYIDRQAKVIMGWKKVPGTYFEVLVVQHPVFQSLEETL